MYIYLYTSQLKTTQCNLVKIIEEKQRKLASVLKIEQVQNVLVRFVSSILQGAFYPRFWWFLVCRLFILFSLYSSAAIIVSSFFLFPWKFRTLEHWFLFILSEKSHCFLFKRNMNKITITDKAWLQEFITPFRSFSNLLELKL